MMRECNMQFYEQDSIDQGNTWNSCLQAISIHFASFYEVKHV